MDAAGDRADQLMLARAEQRRLGSLVSLRDEAAAPVTVGGVDVSYDGDRAVAAAVVLDVATLEPIEQSVVSGEAVFPYIPGMLSMREAPLAIEAVRALSAPPDVLICDGQGIAHPERFGLACHLGVLLDLPTIGCAKNHLVGDFDALKPLRGSRSELRLDGRPVGVALRTQDGVKPLFVSPGHRIGVERAADIVLAAARRHRQPEPIRLADQLSRRQLRAGPASTSASSSATSRRGAVRR